jgi:CubicO group peptidase (beta-lactamase class C family)
MSSSSEARVPGPPVTAAMPLRISTHRVQPEEPMHLRALLFVSLATLSGCLHAPANAPSPATYARIDEIMARYAGHGPGASLLVVQDGVDLVRRGYGLANVEQGSEAGPATQYRLASVTKQFTATAILLLAQDGKLKLDDPVRAWIPALPGATRDITLRHLLTHTSGIVDYEEVMPDLPEGEQLGDADVRRLLAAQDRLYFAPGSAWRYSNSGYALLALVVERASGRSFPDFLRERIFAPLGMEAIAYVRGGPEPAHRAYGYSEADGRWLRTDQSPTSAVLGDGGIYASIDDLAKWDAALYDDRLLDDESRALAFSAATPSDDPDVAYGYGWRITGDTLWHSGETIGFRNVIVRWPGRRLTVAILSNRNDPEPYATALAIGALFIDGEPSGSE